MELISPEGKSFRGFPRIGAYICDYEEARDLTCVYNQRCYHCNVNKEQLGKNINGELRNQANMSNKVKNTVAIISNQKYKKFI
jgi:hypothetical protein